LQRHRRKEKDRQRRHLEEGWKVKQISACALGESINSLNTTIFLPEA